LRLGFTWISATICYTFKTVTHIIESFDENDALPSKMLKNISKLLK